MNELKPSKENRLTSLEKRWILYDIGNSAFILLATTILPIYFQSMTNAANISHARYLAYWGYAASICTILVAILGPILGAAADSMGGKKAIFTITVAIGIASTIAMIFPLGWLGFLVVFVLAKTGFSSSLIFYDSMLTDITTPERMDKVSSYGYALGYIGSCIPFILSLVVIMKHDLFGLSQSMGIVVGILITAVWWLIFTIPLLRKYRQTYYLTSEWVGVGAIFVRLYESLKDLKKHRKAFLFLVSFFFYIDGVYTIIDMAVAFGTSLGLDTTSLLLALLLTQVVAFPFAILFSVLAKKYKNTVLIKICIGAYFLIAIYASMLQFLWQFWILAVAVGMFQGGIQALSRSYFAQIIPKERSGAYFGLMDICGKGAAFLGTFIVSVVSHVTSKQNLGIGAIAVVFFIGYLLFRLAAKEERN